MRTARRACSALPLLLVVACSAGLAPEPPDQSSPAPIGARPGHAQSEKVSGHVVVADGSVHPDERSALADVGPARAAAALAMEEGCDGFRVPFSTWSVVAALAAPLCAPAAAVAP